MRLAGAIGEKRRHVLGSIDADELIGSPESGPGILDTLLVLEHQDLRSVEVLEQPPQLPSTVRWANEAPVV